MKLPLRGPDRVYLIHSCSDHTCGHRACLRMYPNSLCRNSSSPKSWMYKFAKELERHGKRVVFGCQQNKYGEDLLNKFHHEIRWCRLVLDKGNSKSKMCEVERYVAKILRKRVVRLVEKDVTPNEEQEWLNLDTRRPERAARNLCLYLDGAPALRRLISPSSLLIGLITSWIVEKSLDMLLLLLHI